MSSSNFARRGKMERIYESNEKLQLNGKPQIPNNLDTILKSFITYDELRKNYSAHGTIKNTYEEIIARLRDYDIDIQRDLQRLVNRASSQSLIIPELKILDRNYSLKIFSRVKSLESVYKKLCLGEITWEDLPLDDTLGYRLVCRFGDECTELRDIIDNEMNKAPFKLVSRFPRDNEGKWIEKVSDSGYRSYDFAFIYSRPEINLELEGELQLRTSLQHAWAEVSHDTFYKNSDLANSPDYFAKGTSNTMHALSDSLANVDRMFVELRKMIVETTKKQNK